MTAELPQARCPFDSPYTKCLSTFFLFAVCIKLSCLQLTPALGKMRFWNSCSNITSTNSNYPELAFPFLAERKVVLSSYNVNTTISILIHDCKTSCELISEGRVMISSLPQKSVFLPALGPACTTKCHVWLFNVWHSEQERRHTAVCQDHLKVSFSKRTSTRNLMAENKQQRLFLFLLTILCHIFSYPRYHAALG